MLPPPRRGDEVAGCCFDEAPALIDDGVCGGLIGVTAAARCRAPRETEEEDEDAMPRVNIVLAAAGSCVGVCADRVGVDDDAATATDDGLCGGGRTGVVDCA